MTSISKPPLHILLGATGSVASLKVPNIISALRSRFEPEPVEIRLVVTEKAKHFFNVPATVKETGIVCYDDEEEWKVWDKVTDPVVHIDLRNWADILVVAPLDANTLAKVAGGLCDNLLTCTLRAWDTSKPVLLAPAMNTHMWNHPFTSTHLSQIAALRYRLIPPVSKRLACGDEGMGGLASPESIAQEVYGAMRP
ncbi:MAG: flavoprotein [Piptocephalis tieghemiana]|nr:MAG: flavoprotein [Piptocephalis tieghemiana]